MHTQQNTAKRKSCLFLHSRLIFLQNFTHTQRRGRRGGRRGGGVSGKGGEGGGGGGVSSRSKNERGVPFGIPPQFAQALPVHNHLSLGSNPHRHTVSGTPLGPQARCFLQQFATDLFDSRSLNCLFLSIAAPPRPKYTGVVQSRPPPFCTGNR
jgi:hypothetical protein